jgi:hypothetical protein
MASPEQRPLRGSPPPPSDPLGEAVAKVVTDMIGWDLGTAVGGEEADGDLAHLGTRTALNELVDAVPSAVARTSERLRGHDRSGAPTSVDPALRRALRDTVAAEILARYLEARVGRAVDPDLVQKTIDYMIDLSGTRVESHDLTHGVVVTDVLRDTPRLQFTYPDDIRAAKRAPLLFDGHRSVLVVDPEGRARTELQRHRIERFAPGARDRFDDAAESGSLVAEATRALNGLGMFLRADRSIWTFVDGRPLLVRRRERWTAFPLELAASIENMIGGGSVASIVVAAAFRISAQPRGAILAVADAESLEDVVSPKDRYDRRSDADPDAMQIETRLHHLIDASDLDEQTLVRLATLDGATILDREGRLLAYGAIVASAGSRHEGARTAASRSLSEIADVVLNVSVDGDVTIFRDGEAVVTFLGRRFKPPR